MCACYPGGGAAYGAHVDNVDGDGRGDFGRCFTLVYYLNPCWDTARNGGALWIHGEAGVYEVSPGADTLVIFRADQMLHEVRTAPARARPAAHPPMSNFGHSCQ